jgi:demethylmenaquinone methyltransferase/2-methoxy-6-polyprenyl-1,4-benzoquinol methylase
MPGADLDRAVAHYRELAPRYDHFTRRIDAIRARAIASLHLRPGDAVLDAGCGTGWGIEALAEAVAPNGRVIGFDASKEMLALARERPSRVPVALVCADAERVVLPTRVDAVLFSYTHDVIRSRAALDNILRQAKPGARVASTSTKLYAPWLFPANWYLRWSHRAYITNFESFDAPWSLLAEYLDDFQVDTGPFTQHYVATGRVRAGLGQQA